MTTATPDKSMSVPELNCRLEALKQVREWSGGLVTVQTAAIGAIGFGMQRDPGEVAYKWSLGSLFLLLISIYFGAVFLGSTVPYCISTLPYKKADDMDIYHYRGGGGYMQHWTIGQMAKTQSWCFIASLAVFSIASATSYITKPLESTLKAESPSAQPQQ